MRLRLVLLLIMGALPVLAQDRAPYKQQSEGREKNKARVADAYAANLKKYKDDGQALVLPGLVADRKRRRIEIAVESTGLGPDAPCEFMVIGETSGHGYEARLSALAKPSAVHQALRFIGREPGEPYNPDALRFWPKGEPLALTLLRPQQPSIRIEKLIKDQRTGKTLPEAGFLFTGSRMVEQFEHPEKKVYAADEYDPKAIVSLFNSLDAVLQVPYLAPQGAVYANCVINPDVALPEGALMTLVIEPVNPNEARHIKNLVLRVEPGPAAAPRPATDMDRLNSLSVQLQEADTVLNKEPRLRAVLEAITALDRSKNDYFLTIRFGDGVELGQARALAMLMATIDSEQGVRVDPPPAGQLYYKAFLPGPGLLDRADRIENPAELSLVEKDGRVSGQLRLIGSVWKDGRDRPELEIAHRPVSGPQDLRQALEAEAERMKKAQRSPPLKVLLVFAPATLTHGQLLGFLDPVLPTYRIVHVFLDQPLPPIPAKNP